MSVKAGALRVLPHEPGSALLGACHPHPGGGTAYSTRGTDHSQPEGPGSIQQVAADQALRGPGPGKASPGAEGGLVSGDGGCAPRMVRLASELTLGQRRAALARPCALQLLLTTIPPVLVPGTLQPCPQPFPARLLAGPLVICFSSLLARRGEGRAPGVALAFTHQHPQPGTHGTLTPRVSAWPCPRTGSWLREPRGAAWSRVARRRGLGLSPGRRCCQSGDAALLCRLPAPSLVAVSRGASLAVGGAS